MVVQMDVRDLNRAKTGTAIRTQVYEVISTAVRIYLREDKLTTAQDLSLSCMIQ
jgi:hypothetical protein